MVLNILPRQVAEHTLTSWNIARSQKVLKSLSRWKAVGELKNIQMSLGFATTKESVSWKYPEHSMVGQEFSIFSNIRRMEGKTDLLVSALPFYSNHVAFVSF